MSENDKWFFLYPNGSAEVLAIFPEEMEDEAWKEADLHKAIVRVGEFKFGLLPPPWDLRIPDRPGELQPKTHEEEIAALKARLAKLEG